MSLKTYLLSSSIGATGTTTIAIPSAYAYGNGLVKSDPKIKKIKEKNAELTEENKGLERDTEAANKAKEEAEVKTQKLNEENVVLKATNQKLDAEYKQQQKIANEKADAASSISQMANNISQQNTKLISQTVTLANENTKLDSDLKTKNQELKVAKGQGNLKAKVTEYIEGVIDDLGKFRTHNEDNIYQYLKGLSSKSPTVPQDVKNYKWHCKEHKWGTEGAKKGIAYCVLKETEESRSADTTQYTSTYGDNNMWQIPTGFRR